jgi:NadR type nicotinamide-nucleotide adenylyltransferase
VSGRAGHRRGFAIGRFSPPHAGHAYLIDTARASVDALTVAVCERAGDPIPAGLRARWLREAHPDVDVRVAAALPDDGPDASAAYTRAFLGYVPDVVFSSESGGDAYARALGCAHVLVDAARATVPVSAARIRADPLAFLDRVAPPVRGYLARRICAIGPESTGKTVLSGRLAVRFGAENVPEYGRDYTLRKLETPEPNVWNAAEFVHIAREQQRREDEAARRCNGLVVCDTDAFATEIWLERYLGRQHVRGWPERDRPIDLYLLTGPDVPFVADAIRDGEHLRAWMFDRFAEELTRRGLPFVVLRGTYAERDAAAIEAVESVMRAAKIG